MLEQIGLDESCESRYINELSGGQRQRCGRALPPGDADLTSDSAGKKGELPLA
ncbi:hypothetical protein ACFOQM_02180 [Paenibacillus sp. GCM10012307]|uniref:hypothetical protein n=1 Tax=Paenibacillus sp. GCM10012307 TaxID=3317343 RepID=UPI003613C8F9